MFQHVLAFLLINTYYQSSGSPIEPKAVNHSISDSLRSLTLQCKNKFLLEQIQGKIQECDITAPPYREQQFQCLMFYDINHQLCSAFDNTKTLNEDYAVQVNGKQNVITFCSSTNDFVFTELPEYPVYKKVAEKYFKWAATCGKVCGFNDLSNEDANFYCKYYKWGLDLLKKQSTSTVASSSNNNSPVPAPDISAGNGDILVLKDDPVHVTDTKTVINEVKKTVPEVPTSDVSKANPSNLDQVSVPAIVNSDNVSNKAQTPKLVQQTESDKSEDIGDNNGDALDDPSLPNDKDLLSKITEPGKESVDNDGKPKINAGNAPDTDKNLAVQTDQRDAVIDNPANQKLKQVDDNNMDYGVSNEDKGDGQDDEDMDGLGEINEPEQSKDKNPLDKNDNLDKFVQKGYPHVEPEEFTEDDDHFFPFFLTAVIMVVLLYVLYHNKNKVTKVFFGLILEGRQNGRRRNSRGHAYRRLDTLEQAMSANTAAPPSKIIY